MLGCTGRSVDELPLTHKPLSHMLEVRQARVSEAAETLRDQGLIRYHRGQITITDRPGLEAATCEDYLVFIEEYEHVLGPAPKSA